MEFLLSKCIFWPKYSGLLFQNKFVILVQCRKQEYKYLFAKTSLLVPAFKEPFMLLFAIKRGPMRKLSNISKNYYNIWIIKCIIHDPKLYIIIITRIQRPLWPGGKCERKLQGCSEGDNQSWVILTPNSSSPPPSSSSSPPPSSSSSPPPPSSSYPGVATVAGETSWVAY